MFVRTDTGAVCTVECRLSVAKLTNILFKLDAISKEQALNISTKFRVLFV